MADVYITKISVFLPNNPISNEEMEEYLGFISGNNSKFKRIVLRSNGIEQRHYAMDKEGVPTHTNAEMVAKAIEGLFEVPSQLKEVELLACGTSTTDMLLPSHAVMVHGLLPNSSYMEVISNSGSCCSGMQSFKHAYLSIKSEDKIKVICSGSERVSPQMRASCFEEELKHLSRIEENPYVAFQKDFLRWMLSDGAGVFLLQNKKGDEGLSLKVEWVEICSFANILPVCMYMGAEKDEKDNLIGYQDMPLEEVVRKSVLSIKQDIKLLSENIVTQGFNFLSELLEKKSIDVSKVDYFLPHMSSLFFKEKIYRVLEENNIPIPYEKWFINLKDRAIQVQLLSILCWKSFFLQAN